MKNLSVHLLTALVILAFVAVTILIVNSPVFEYAYLAGITLFVGWLLVMWYQIIFGWITKFKKKRNKEVL